MLVLADQAAVTAEDLRRLAGTWRRQPDYIVARSVRRHAGRAGDLSQLDAFGTCTSCAATGVPSAVQAQSGSRGPRAHGSAAIDIDTPEDLLRLDPARR